MENESLFYFDVEAIFYVDDCNVVCNQINIEAHNKKDAIKKAQEDNRGLLLKIISIYKKGMVKNDNRTND